jgi:hypothetical protein
MTHNTQDFWGCVPLTPGQSIMNENEDSSHSDDFEHGAGSAAIWR